MATIVRMIARYRQHNALSAFVHALGVRTTASAAGSSGQYWIPPEPELQHGYMQSKGQQRFTSRVEHAIETSLLTDAVLREALVEQNAFTVHHIRISRDRRTAFILWDCHPSRKDACERILQHNAFRLRRSLARLLQAKQVPFMEFRHDRLPEDKANVVRVMKDADLEYEQLETTPPEQDAEVAAAARDLQEEMQLKRRFSRHSQDID